MKTGFSTANGHDLGSVFKHIKEGDVPVEPTGFRIKDGRDFAELFAPYSGGKKADPVGFRLADGRDLCEVFAAHGE